MTHVMLDMLGIRIRIESNNRELIDYVPLHLPDHVVPDAPAPQITVNVRWLDRDATDDMRFPGQEHLDRIGKRLLAGPRTLVWTDTLRMKNLMLRFELDGEHLHVDAIFRFAARPDKLAEQPNYRFRKMFSLMSWFVYQPLAWYLEHFRGMYMLHASGLDLNGHGIVIGGVGGVGKTTTGVSLLAAGARLVSENLVFYDEQRIYSCYEPIRLDDNSVEILGARRDILRRAAIPEGSNHKNLYQVDRARAVVDSAEAMALFLPRFTAESFVRPIDVEAACERLVAFNELTREINDYYWYAATLNVLWPTPHSLERRARTLRAFLERMGRWEIGIDRRRGVEPVVQSIQELTSTGART